MTIFNLSKKTQSVLDILAKNGFEAFLVGGCVRDMLMEKNPSDYDICTNALPAEIKSCFSAFKQIDLGIEHGTVCVIFEGENYEITTFRCENSYKDKRHPERVEFVSSIEEDLKRRDFTINALAYSPQKGLIDQHNGLKDLESKTIRTVGNPYDRFEEDSLRLLRATRFSSTLKFNIETNTKSAIKVKAENISFSSKERQYCELNKLILGEDCAKTILENKELFFAIIPELENMYNCTQETKYHKFNVFDHSVTALSHADKNAVLRMAVLLHDVGKPQMKTIDSKGIAHFKGHAKTGADIAKKILENLRFPKKEIREICTLIHFHNRQSPKTDRDIVRLFSQIGTDATINLMRHKFCDTMGKADFVISENAELYHSRIKRAKDLSKINPCYKISQLEINGSDLKKLGIKEGEAIGKMLKHLLDCVIKGNINNSKEELTHETLLQKAKT